MIICHAFVTCEGYANGGNIIKQNARMKTHECRRLHLCCMELDRGQTRGLVAALESGVEDAVVLGHGGALTLHMETLAQYGGSGRCGCVDLWDQTSLHYREQVNQLSIMNFYLEFQIHSKNSLRLGV